MAILPGKAIRKFVIISCVGLLAIGAVASVVTIVSARGRRDADLIRSTQEANGLVSRVYEYRKSTGKYPLSLAELRPIARDVASKHVKKGPADADDDFCATWCWSYIHRGDESPPILRRYVGDHGYLIYEFAPSSGYYYPGNVDEGWIVTSEGSRRYLQSFFSKKGKPATDGW
jgi:hypothetical protein